MRRVSALLTLAVLAWGCDQNKVTTGDPSPTPTTVKDALTLTGPPSLVEGECGPFTIAVERAGAPSPVAIDTNLDLAAGANGSFYSDATCATAATTVVMVAGNSSINVFVQVDVNGIEDLDVSDPTGGLAPASRAVSIEALVLPSYAVSTYNTGGNFQNGTWTIVEEAVGVPLTAGVTVPQTGRWFVEVHAKVSLLEGNGSQTGVRLRETDSAASAVADQKVFNASEDEVFEAGLVYFNENPVPGETYSYTLELSTNGNNSIYNPNTANIGPGGDQITGSQSSITVFVRKASH